MKTKNSIQKMLGVTILLIVVTAVMGLLNPEDHFKPEVENDFIRKAKSKLDTAIAAHPEDRVYMQFDKPFYKPGETIWFAAYIRNGKDFTASEKSDILHVQLTGPKGNVEKEIKLIGKNGRAVGDFTLDAEAAGGLYKVKAFTKWQKNEPDTAFFEKELTVQDVVLPDLKMKLDFERKAFGPGDEVVAKVELNTNENHPLVNYAFKYVANLEGKKLYECNSVTGNDGIMYIRFKLPESLKSNDGLVNVLVDYQGQTESVSQSIPIVLNNVTFTMFPEGGDLVNGLESRVAFRALNEFGKPADVEGDVYDSNDKLLTHFISYHMGMGAFNIKPEGGRKYYVKISKPENIKQKYELPEPLPRGYVLSTDNVNPGELVLNVKSTEDEELNIIAQTRGKICYATSFNAVAGNNKLVLPASQFPIGVAQVTLFDSKGIARAERLVFLNKSKQLSIAIETDKEKYLPREKVKMTVTVRDDRGMPMPASLSLAVVNDQLLSFADDKSGNILSKLLLENDIKGKVEEPAFYFDTKEPKADMALDYLMMTAGWRRYTWEKIMNGDIPVAIHAGERSILAGTIIDQNTAKPVSKAKIKINGTNQEVAVNENGDFVIDNLDLTVAANINISAEGYIPQDIAVYDYKQDAKYYLTGEPFNNGRTQAGEITGKLIDKQSKEPIPFATVTIERNGAIVGGAQTDIDGKYSIKPLTPGKYNVRASYVGYTSSEVTGVLLSVENIEEINLEMNKGMELGAVEVVGYKNPIMDKANTATQTTITQQQIVDAPVRDVNALAAQTAGIYKHDSGAALNIRPSRGNATMYYMDGQEDQQARLRERVANGNAAKYVRPRQKPAPQVVQYYRAKEFPAVIYDKPQENVIRNDFRSTIYWNGNVSVDRTGKGIVEFYNSDDISSFRATVEGISADGMIGRCEKAYFTQLPFAMSVKAPVEVTTEDKVSIPFTLKNNTTNNITGVLMVKPPQGFKGIVPIATVQKLAAGEVKIVYLDYQVMNITGDDNLDVSFTSSGSNDAFTQKIRTVAKGFPVTISFSGQEAKKEYSVNLQNVVTGSISAQFTAYPSVISDLMKGVEGILREPNGCFEQTSVSSYPNVLVLDYLKATDNKDERLLASANGFVDRGYKRLTTFETKEKGYEWFGAVPANEALTAYGLMQFNDMKAVYSNVDQAMIDRTANWLMSRKDGNGGFKRSAKAVDSFGRAPEDITNAYIVYALTEAGYLNLDKEINVAYEKAIDTKDPYQLALLANTLYKTKDKGRADKVLAELLTQQNADGSWTGTTSSITHSGGKSLTIETTSLAVLAIMNSTENHTRELNKAVAYIVDSRSGYGSFGSSQGTILALKALTEYAKYSKHTNEDGTIEFYVDDKKVAEKSYKAGDKDAVVIDSLEKFLKPGKHDLKVKYIGVKNPLPYSIAVTYNTSLPNSSKDCKVNIETKLFSNNIKAGETVRLNATLTNTTKEGLPSTMAIIGIPAGLSPQPWQLKEMQEKHAFDYYEVKGNTVICYYRQMAPSEIRTINFDLKADVPGVYESPASSAYLYYTNEYKCWTSIGNLIIQKR